ncbi:MAG TPA: hypothetical protein DCM70_01780 [Rhodobacteraceae bacterium]|nr:hypothetical protein [Paracoccaceae bacterium]
MAVEPPLPSPRAARSAEQGGRSSGLPAANSPEQGGQIVGWYPEYQAWAFSKLQEFLALLREARGFRFAWAQALFPRLAQDQARQDCLPPAPQADPNHPELARRSAPYPRAPNLQILAA